MESLNQQKAVAFGILTIFGSPYIREETFSNMNFIKTQTKKPTKKFTHDGCIKWKTTD